MHVVITKGSSAGRSGPSVLRLTPWLTCCGCGRAKPDLAQHCRLSDDESLRARVHLSSPGSLSALCARLVGATHSRLHCRAGLAALEVSGSRWQCQTYTGLRACLCREVRSFRRQARVLAGLPGPQTSHILGFKDILTSKEPQRLVLDMAERYGPIFSFRFIHLHVRHSLTCRCSLADLALA